MTKLILGARTTASVVAANLVVGIAIFNVAVPPARANNDGSNVVTTCSGSGHGSLPEVMSNATAGEIVDVAVSCPANSPVVLGNTIEISPSLSIDGPGP